jgi:hypothetical protein
MALMCIFAQMQTLSIFQTNIELILLEMSLITRWHTRKKSWTYGGDPIGMQKDALLRAIDRLPLRPDCGIRRESLQRLFYGLGVSFSLLHKTFGK